jgi:large subunit ribosomal protein L1
VSKKDTIQKLDSVELEQKINTLKSFAIDPRSESFEVHFRLNINPKMPEQMFVQKCTLPNSTGKDVKIIAFVSEAQRQQALQAGADFIADEENINKIKANKIFFDFCVASPDAMKLLSPLAKILGPRGLMPNAKLGTLTPNITEAIRQLKGGQVSIKNDRNGLLHVMIGKCNASLPHIRENLEYLVDFVQSKRPSAVKGNFIETVFLSTTQGPSVSLTK